MKKISYERPQLEVLDLAVEQGFAASVVTDGIGYDGFDSETEL